jgi:hypothetical protein
MQADLEAGAALLARRAGADDAGSTMMNAMGR